MSFKISKGTVAFAIVAVVTLFGSHLIDLDTTPVPQPKVEAVA